MCGRIDKEINIWLVHMAGGSVLNGLIVRRCEGGKGEEEKEVQIH